MNCVLRTGCEHGNDCVQQGRCLWKRGKAHPKTVSLEVCPNCCEQKKPVGSMCLSCGYDTPIKMTS